jgi:hypothetical protein
MSEPVKFTFNLFTIEGAVHALDPSLTEAEIAAAYDSFVGRGVILLNPSPPYSRVEQLICDVLLRQANALVQEQLSPKLS